jgi:DNA replication protein DnaC
MEELKNPPSLAHSRIYDRVLEMCPIRLKLVGESRRAKIANERRDKAKKLLGME